MYAKHQAPTFFTTDKSGTQEISHPLTKKMVKMIPNGSITLLWAAKDQKKKF